MNLDWLVTVCIRFGVGTGVELLLNADGGLLVSGNCTFFFHQLFLSCLLIASLVSIVLVLVFSGKELI